jgi:hypothetical protein
VLRTKALGRFARTDEGALFGAILGLLVAAIVAAILLPPQGPHRSFKREQGSLVAPPAESEFNDLLAAPIDPLALAASSPPDATPEPSPPGTPRKPAPRVPSPPQPPPPDDGLLPDLPILPPPPPPLRGVGPALAGLLRGQR